MNSKTKHRILGVVVLIGLVVIMLPFLQNRHDLSPDTKAIQQPAFPDQSAQLTPSTQDQETMQNVAEISPQPSVPVTVNEAEPSAPAAVAPTPTPNDVPVAPTPSSEEPKTSPDDTIKNDHPVDQSKTVPPISSTDDNTAKTVIDDTSADATATTKKSVTKRINVHASKKISKHAQQVAIKASKKLHAQNAIRNNSLFNIQDPAWVIQVGSFNNKTAALKVVNHLRANGYRAFIQQFAANGEADSTRVFVGPQNKQAEARSLASELKSHMKVQGIVISYKPLDA